MPAPMIKSFAEKSGKSEKEVEDLYKKAEGIVKKQYELTKEDGDKYYALVTGVLKKSLGLKESYMTFKDYLSEKKKWFKDSELQGNNKRYGNRSH